MKQGAGAGFAVALAVAVAAVRLGSGAGSAAPRATLATLRAPQPGEARGAKHPVKPSGYKGGCTAYDLDHDDEQPKDLNQGTAKSGLDTFFRLDAAQETKPQLAAANGVRYAIALAPDPRHTNLSLLFDREMVVVQEAAQDAGYTYNSSWLPWSDDAPKYALRTDQEAADEDTSHREACPGMLLFRKSLSDLQPDATKRADPYGEALVVLVVGEQPTGGINEDQWANAVHWLAENASPEAVGDDDSGTKTRTLRVLGPTFSGSLVALERDLGGLYGAGGGSDAARLQARFPRMSILSGSVSSCSSIHWFQGRLRQSNLAPAVQFGSFQENDELHIYRFFSYLSQLGTDIRDTAVLSEDETAYANSYHPASEAEYVKAEVKAERKAAAVGQRAAPSCDFPYADASRPLRLSYPRDISALRAAYEKQAVFATPGRSSSSVHAILQDTAEQGAEGPEAADTIKAFAGPMSAVAQEAVLYGVVSYLRVHHTRYLLLRCSNPLDFLFLTRFFHRAYPEGRIVTVGSDLLYRREIDTTEFRGVMALTGYPLLPLNQHWSRLTENPGASPSHVHRVFESHMEGAYLAARYLFNAARPVPPVAPEETVSFPWLENIPDYADPFWLHQPSERVRETRGPTWLTVVGRDGYWPLAVLNPTTTPSVVLEERGASRDQPQGAPPSTLVRLTSSRAHYQLGTDQSSFHNFQLLKFPLSWKICAGGSLLLLLYQALGITIGAKRASSTGLFSVFRRFASPSQSLLLGVNCAFAAMLFLALLSMGWTVPNFADLDKESWDFWACLVLALATIVCIAWVLFFHGRRPAAYAFLGALAALGTVAAATFSSSKLPANAVPIFDRMGHLNSGVSPLLPVLFLLAGMYLWTWQAMAGNAILRCGRPTLPKLRGECRTFGWVNHFHERLMQPPPVPGGSWIVRLVRKLRHRPQPPVQAGWNCLSKSKYRMSYEMGKRIINMASPVSLELEVIGFPLCLAAVAWVCFHRDIPLLGIESHSYALCINLALLFAFFLTAAEAARLFWTWREFKRMLTELSRLRLRRTFAKMRAVDANSLWSVSGNVHRVQYLFFSQQLDAVIRLARQTKLLSVLDADRCGRAFASMNADRISNGPQWEENFHRPGTTITVNIRTVFADAAADVFNTILWPEWKKETTSLSLENCAAEGGEKERNVFDMELSKNETVRTAEEFVCFQYMAFIQNILARMRTMTLSMVFLFLSVCFSISFYPFVPRTQIGLWMLANLVLIGSSVIYVYAGMERDEVLSYIANTRPGQLSGEFWIKTVGFLAGPVIGLLTTQFPSIAESVLGWLQPGLDAIK